MLNVDLRTCIRALVLSHLDRGSEEALSIKLTVRSDVWLVLEHLKAFAADAENELEDELPQEAFAVADIRLVVSRPSNYTKVYRAITVRGAGEPFETAMELVADHDSCWIDGALDAVKEASTKATQMAIEEAKDMAKAEFHEFYESVRPSMHLHIENVERCVINTVEGEPGFKSGPVKIEFGSSENKTSFI